MAEKLTKRSAALVLMGPGGRLGNRLWTYANLLAFAQDHGFDVLNPSFIESSYLFRKGSEGKSLRKSHGSNVLRRVKLWLWRRAYSLNLRLRFFLSIDVGESGKFDLEAHPDYLMRFRKSGLVFLSGLFFSAPTCMARQRQYLLSYFALNDELEVRCQALVAAARKGEDVLVGIHIRHGDYRTYCNGLMYYSTPEFVTVMKNLANQVQNRNVRFLICSDEPQARSFFEGLNVVISDEIAVVDLYALAACDFICGPNSTFSQWASFYGGVPLHVLDYKSQFLSAQQSPNYSPRLDTDFSPFNIDRFSQYSTQSLQLADFLRRSRTWHKY